MIVIVISSIILDAEVAVVLRAITATAAMHVVVMGVSSMWIAAAAAWWDAVTAAVAVVRVVVGAGAHSSPIRLSIADR